MGIVLNEGLGCHMFEKFNIKRFVLCADDFGATLGINQGILTLAEMNRITATSCLANAPYFASGVKALVKTQDKLDIGIHLNLTEGQALSQAFIDCYGKNLFSFPTLLRLCLLRKINRSVIEAEWVAQIEQFISHMGMLPDFMDGHQHVHQLPFLYETFLSVFRQYQLKTEKPMYVRWVHLSSTHSGWKSKGKQWIANYLLAPWRAKKKLEQAEIFHNGAFSGMYAFGEVAPYASWFPKFLNVVHQGACPIIMCHPATLGLTSDPLALRRVEEFVYLKSAAYLKACVEATCFPTRFYIADGC